MTRLEPSRTLVAGLGLFGVLLYSIWLAGPYLRSIAVRDAAVTTWIHVATAPIDGQLAAPSRRAGERVGDDGLLATVVNPRFDDTGLARATADLETARERVAALTAVVRDHEGLVASRQRLAGEFALTFKRNLDVSIPAMTELVAANRRRLLLERTEANRRATAGPGVESQSAADAAMARVAEAEFAVADWSGTLDRAAIRRRAADAGAFVLDDLSDAGAAQRSLEDARIARDHVRAELAMATTAVEAAQAVVDRASRVAAENRSAPLVALPGGLVWNLFVAAPAAVHTGTPVATWVDCRVLLVDAPISDVGLSLLRPGAPASVVLEGERRARMGTVLLLRGSASTMGASELAAVAKGRHPGVGQAIVKLEPTAADLEVCPVGRAAFVHFPDVTVLSVARARLRW